MNKSMIARVLSALLLIGIMTFGFTPAASAASPADISAASVQLPAKIDGEDESPNTARSVCGNTAGSTSKAGDSELLPVNRWADATAVMHSRLDNSFLSDTAELMQRHAIISTGMASGNFMWSLGTGMSAFAINFCMLDKMGGAADGVVATIGNALLDSTLLSGLVVVALIVLLFQGRKNGQMPWKKIVQKGVVLALFAAMTAGAMASTGGGKSADPDQPYDSTKQDTPYVPGVMSPGWIVMTMNNTISSLAIAPAAALALSTTNAGAIDQNNLLSCDNYLISLKQGYQNKYGDSAESLAAGVPLIMSSLWETTGLKTWRTAQFGNSDVDKNSWCRLLEWNAGVRTMSTDSADDKGQWNSAGTVRATMARIMPQERAFSFNYSNISFVPASKADTDKSLVAWAACRFANNDGGGNLQKGDQWKIATHFDLGDKDKKSKTDNCASWFTSQDDHAGGFDWSSNQDDVQERTTGTGVGNDVYALDVRDFILTLHGNNNSQGMTAVFAYNISALAMLVVFGLLALSILIAKIAMVVMIITGIFMVIMALLPNAGFDKFGSYLKTLLGINIFTFAIQLLFALVSIITLMLQNLGNSFMGGPGSLVAIFWSGLSPLLAVFLLHMMFTKVLKVPSPFKLSAAMAWGGTVAAAGGAAVGGVGALMDRKVSNAGRRAMGKATGAGKRGMNSVLGKASGGRLGGTSTRRGAAAPATAANGPSKASVSSTNGGVPAALNGRRGKQGQKNHMAGDVDEIQSRLLNSDVANSQVAKGKMSAADRKAMADAGKAELAAAQEHRASEREALGFAPEVTPGGQVVGALSKTVAGAVAAGSALGAAGKASKKIVSHPIQSGAQGFRATGDAAKSAAAGIGAGAKSAAARATVSLGNLQSHPIRTLGAGARNVGAGARSIGTAAGKLANSKAVTAVRFSNAAAQFKERPFKSTAKVAGAGLLLAATTPALAIPAVAAGAWVAAKGVQEAHRRTVGRKAHNDQVTAEYRQAMRHQNRGRTSPQPSRVAPVNPVQAPATATDPTARTQAPTTTQAPANKPPRVATVAGTAGTPVAPTQPTARVEAPPVTQEPAKAAVKAPEPAPAPEPATATEPAPARKPSRVAPEAGPKTGPAAPAGTSRVIPAAPVDQAE